MSKSPTPKNALTRRTLLKLSAATGVGTILTGIPGCGSSPAGENPFGDAGPPVGESGPIPPMLEGELVDGVRVYKLNLQEGSVEWVPGNPTPTYGINGPVLGPTLHLRVGESVRIEVTNSLQEISSIHWHGMELPARSDGGPYQPIDPGVTWVSEFEVIQRPMLAWYHPHRMDFTGRHVYMGMAGLIYVDDSAQNETLPSTYGVDDLPLVIQDKRFSADGTHPYSAGNSLPMRDRVAGLKGDTLLVNGGIEPEYAVPQGLVRLRILNGSNARNYNLGFSDNRSFLQIGCDGGLLDAPIDTTRLLLAPAERAEILVDFSADASGDLPQLQSYSGEVVSALFTGNMGGNIADARDRDTFNILSFKVGEPPAQSIAAPTSFTALERISEASAVRTREIALSMRMGGVFINDQRMLEMDSVPAEINFRINEGETEIWRVTNSSGMAHPLHLHNRHFQVLDIDGQAPEPSLAGWKDTILVRPDQVVRLLVEFRGTPDEEFPYMFHCHILEHEDGGMMGQFYIV